MGISYRMLLVDQSDRIYRLAVAKFDEMLSNPSRHRYPHFAGQRVRAAGAVVQLVGRKPTQVVRMTFHILTFDGAGCFNAKTFNRQQFSRFEVGITQLMSVLRTEVDADTGVVDASSRFTAQGGQWVPSTTLARAIHDAALGRGKCTRL
jgi:hypothetical protein